METISHLPWKPSPPVQLSDPKAARETLRSRSHEPLQLILSCLIQLEACGSKHHLQIWLLHPSRAPWQKLVWISRCSTFWEKKPPTKPKPNPKQTKKDLSRTHLIYHLSCLTRDTGHMGTEQSGHVTLGVTFITNLAWWSFTRRKHGDGERGDLLQGNTGVSTSPDLSPRRRKAKGEPFDISCWGTR